MAMKRYQWKPSEYSVLCEKHFTPDDYVMGATNKLKKYLKSDAVPSVFDFPPHLEKETNPRKCPMKRKAASTSAVPDVPNKKPKRNSQPVGHDHIYCTSPSKVIPKMKKSLENKRSPLSPSSNLQCHCIFIVQGATGLLENHFTYHVQQP
jgi:hypothetical protein